MAIINPVTSSAAATAGAVGTKLVGQTFDTFLKLLTTQLKNQNPLDPLDTNQFTQQLVQFAQVEQQMNMNSSLSTLISLQQTAQLTQAVDIVGKTVTVSGDTTQLANGQAVWNFSSASAGRATITIADASGQTVFSGDYTVTSGSQSFTWDGRGTNNSRLPDGQYKMSIAVKDGNGQSVAVSTEVTGVVESVDLTKTPPLVSIGGQAFPLNQVEKVVRAGP